MPKVVVYVRAEDARVIEATEGRAIELWVRSVVRDEIAHWHLSKVSAEYQRREPYAPERTSQAGLPKEVA
jgi:hypothetical protein